jgi:nucleotide-binding universal stress UspA family protein
MGIPAITRAVHDALPLLRLSGSVHIVKMIDAEDNEIDTTSLSAHLANHGIKVEAHVLQIGTVEEHVSLHNQLEHGHYDLLVMGGILASQLAGIPLRRRHPLDSLVIDNTDTDARLAREQFSD